MPNASSRKHNGNGCGLNAAFCIGQGSLLTLNTNGRVLFSHLCGLKKTRGGHRGAHRTSAAHKHFHFCENIFGIIEIGSHLARFQRREKAEFTLESRAVSACCLRDR